MTAHRPRVHVEPLFLVVQSRLLAFVCLCMLVAALGLRECTPPLVPATHGAAR